MKFLGLVAGLLGLGTLVVVLGSSELDKKNRLAVWEEFLKKEEKLTVYFKGKEVDKSKVDFTILDPEEWQCDIVGNKAYLTQVYTNDIDGFLPVKDK